MNSTERKLFFDDFLSLLNEINDCFSEYELPNIEEIDSNDDLEQDLNDSDLFRLYEILNEAIGIVKINN